MTEQRNTLALTLSAEDETDKKQFMCNVSEMASSVHLKQEVHLHVYNFVFMSFSQ